MKTNYKYVIVIIKDIIYSILTIVTHYHGAHHPSNSYLNEINVFFLSSYIILLRSLRLLLPLEEQRTHCKP
jgi:hypothetical protein